jgi:glutathione synthase/RimK-type ligase-like ATP-grasp enzyme
MTTDRHVLILSTIADVATDYVVQGLRKRGIPHHRVNTEDLPFSRSLTLELGTGGQPSLKFDDLTESKPSSVWYRRIRSPACPVGMQEGVYEFCLQESRAALLGSIAGYKTRWMSHPAEVWRAELKPYQLQLAQEIGLRIPKTLVTNDPDSIRKAFHTFGPMIVKPSRSGYAVVDGQERSIYTSRLLAEHLEHVDEARLSPAIYQELIPKRYDVRATVVGTDVFAAAIHSQTDPAAAVDWRHTDNPDLPHTPIELPTKVRESVLALMSKLGLSFGAVDLVETPDGEFIFLEVNPNGQWLWIDDQLQLGITNAIVDWHART